MKIKFYNVSIFLSIIFCINFIKPMKYGVLPQWPIVTVSADQLDDPILGKYNIKSIGYDRNSFKDTVTYIGITHKNERIVYKIHFKDKQNQYFKTYFDVRKKSYGKYYYPHNEARKIGKALQRYYLSMVPKLPMN